MLSQRVLLAALVGLLASTAHVRATVVEEDDVVVLTVDNFDEWVNAQPLALVEFYAPWCGHCKTLAPEWAQVAGEMKLTTPPVASLAKVDATENEKLAQRFGVEGYPTIFTFRHGVKSEYDGPREAPGILQWIDEQGPPTFEVVSTVEDAKAFAKSVKVAVLGVIRPPMESSKIFDAIKLLSKEMKDDVDVGFAVESGAHWDHKVNKYVASAVGSNYGVDMGVVVLVGDKVVPCNIKAKKFSKKTLKKCVMESTKQQEL